MGAKLSQGPDIETFAEDHEIADEVGGLPDRP
jgi:hypothetical protein